MPEMTDLSSAKGKNQEASFTLVELLTVITIIAILAALTLGVATGLWTKAARSRAAGEIQAMSTALDGYKADNGVYPPSDGVLLTNNYAASDGSPGGTYVTNSVLLYEALSGQTNYSASPTPGIKSYMAFKINQIGNTGGPYSYIIDPWRYAYGYSTGTAASYPYTSTGFFDLWSTGGLLHGSGTNAYVPNWQQ